jgi:methylthioribose-1-phosphate isomerase
MNLMRTVSWNFDENTVDMIDQRLLPGEFEIASFRDVDQVADAITNMVVRGAPAIGAATAFGMALAAQRSSAQDSEALFLDLKSAGETLKNARPTAVNLTWAIEQMLTVAEGELIRDHNSLRALLLQEALRIADEDIQTNRRIGQHGAALLPMEGTVIHHCNTGALATVDYGTALGVIRYAHEDGKKIHVLVDETRPRLQGARLTAWELEQLGIPYEIIADNAAGSFLATGNVSAVLVGADRVAANGDVANKIGTYMLALAAKDNNIPFYVAAPTTTIDLKLSSGDEIPIEQRDAGEVLDIQRAGKPIAPANSQARNPAFDITPHRLVTSIITEHGVHSAPFIETLKSAVQKSRNV